MFIGENPRLEAVFDEIAGAPCAVITHPHPLYGGNMHNNVVMALRNSALSNGFSALRFNFRGTGMSEGRYDNGKGELKDLDAAIRSAGSFPLLIGYSFGAWIASLYIENNDLPCILVSPPNKMFNVSIPIDKNAWIIASESDDFADMSHIKKLLPGNRITICPGIDHFWFGKEDVLTEKIDQILAGLKAGYQ